MSAESPSRAARFLALCNHAAERIGGDTKPTDGSALHLAALLLSQEDYVARMIDGEHIDPDVLLRLDEAIRAVAKPKAITVELLIVNPSMTLCPGCNTEFEPAESGNASCPACGVVFAPQSSDAMREKAQAKAIPDKPNGNGAPPPFQASGNGVVNEPEVKAAPKPAPVPPPDPVGNHGAACWTGYMGGHRQYGAATPDVNPNFNSDGSPRSPYGTPY